MDHKLTVVFNKVDETKSQKLDILAKFNTKKLPIIYIEGPQLISSQKESCMSFTEDRFCLSNQ